jgi:hypothetical protein
MAIIVVILLLCVISLLIPVIYFTSQGVPLEDIPDKVQEYLPESMQDAAYKREMEKIKNERGEASADLQDKRQDASKKRAEASQAEAEAARSAQVFTKPEATQEEKNAAAAKLAEAAAAAEAARQAEAEAAAEAQRNREAQAQAQRDAQALATLKDGCKNVVWNNVFVDGRVGVDVTYANGRSISATPANSTGLTKGNAKVTVTTAKKTIFSRREQTGRNSRGVPEYSWKSKAEYDGIVKISGSKVGYTKMKKKPNSQQPSSCKRGQPMKYNCQFESDGFEELHDFNDTTKPLILMHHKSYTGVMQGETGEFYSFQDKKVIGNPYSSDCQTKLDYK